MAGRLEYGAPTTGHETPLRYAPPEPTECPKCGADLDDGECEECERSAPLDFDQ